MSRRDDGPQPAERSATNASLTRRALLKAGALGGALIPLGALRQPAGAAEPTLPAGPSVAPASFELAELTFADLQAGLAAGRWTSRSLSEAYLGRIEALDRQGPALRSVLEVNPEALALADALDAERKAKGPRGPLHGIPILLKDNIATADRMQTTAGSLALAGVPVPRDAFIAARLRAAGALLLGKTNLSEWANFRSSHSSSGWSGRGGQCRNPYALDRSPSGSSSGSGAAAAANLAAAAVGTETDGSIVSPAAACGLVGIKPTVGLLSRAGIVPISHTQDTPGPMARTVADAAALLAGMLGIDERDAATAASRGKAGALADVTKLLDPNGLKGARIGVLRKRYTGYSPATDSLFEEALDALRKQGAVIVDPADLATAGKMDAPEYTVLLYDFKADLDSYLGGLNASIRSLADAIAFNEKHGAEEMPYFGQEIFLQAQAKGPLSSKEYRDALAACRRLTRKEGIDATLARHKLDALVAPTQGPAWLIDLVNGDFVSGGSSTPAAVAGYPSITVPMGAVRGLPVGLSWIGPAWSEPLLIRLAFAYEQATQHRRPPAFLPTVPS
jgi:amidase